MALAAIFCRVKKVVTLFNRKNSGVNVIFLSV